MRSSATSMTKPGPAPLRIGRYRVRERVGAGGQGVIYEAYDPQLDRAVALKVQLPLGAALPADGSARVATDDEARSIAAVSHPNVLPVYDVGTLRTSSGQEFRFIAVEHIEGVDLREWLRKPRRWSQIVDLFIELAAGGGSHAPGRTRASRHQAGERPSSAQMVASGCATSGWPRPRARPGRPAARCATWRRRPIAGSTAPPVTSTPFA